MDGKPNGGVFSANNLSLYSYSTNNPINLIDPDGRFTYDPGEKQFSTDKGDTFEAISNLTGSSIDTLKGVNPNATVGKDGKLESNQQFNVPETNNIKAFKWAASKLGDTDYSYSAANRTFGPNSNKCNQFVADAYKKGAGQEIPRHSFLGITRKGPARANELYEMGNTDISKAKLGNIMAFQRHNDSGHATLYTGSLNIKGQAPPQGYGTIGASHDMVRFRDQDYLNNDAYLYDASFLRIGE